MDFPIRNLRAKPLQLKVLDNRWFLQSVSNKSASAWLGLTHRSACPGSVDWEPAWPARFPVSLWRCACTGPGGWMEAWWRTWGRRPRSSHTESVGGSGSQTPSDPAEEERHRKLNVISTIKILGRFCCTLMVLTVLMFTLMTGMRERQDDAGSGLSALIFTLHKEEKKITLTAVKQRCISKSGP